jgi:KUP system potassium uptake protein
MGHCGRKNIRISWIFVKSLVLNYFGQAAFKHEGETLQNKRKSILPYYA